MDKQEIIIEAKERLSSLKDTSQRRREWYQDLAIKIADRQSEHLVFISSISATILALTVAFSTQRNNIWVEFSFWLLMFTVFVGTILVLKLIFFDKKASEDERRVELSTYDILKASTENVIQHPEQYNTHKNDFKNEMEKIEKLPYIYSSEKKFLSAIYVIVLVAFVGGVLSLIGAWVVKPISNTIYFNSFVYLLSITLFSLILGIIKFGSLKTTGWSWQRKFAEIWNCTINFFLAGLVGYYFILIRWPLLSRGGSLDLNDFVLFAIITMGLFGHLNVLSYNITNGIEAILKRVLER